MTTNKQLQDWLSRFDDDALINVLTSQECAGHWESYVSVYVEALELPDVHAEDLNWSNNFGKVVFDIQYDYEQPCCTIVKSITLGKAHNE